eukprot:1967355-Alexandrium_andersonii.AAC.2
MMPPDALGLEDRDGLPTGAEAYQRRGSARGRREALLQLVTTPGRARPCCSRGPSESTCCTAPCARASSGSRAPPRG